MLGVLVALAAALPSLVSAPPAPVQPPRDLPPNSETVSDYTVAISPAGEVEQCRLRASSGYGALDVKGCPTLKAARFAPATDGGGTAVHGLLDAQVKWPQGQVVVGASAPDVELVLSHMPTGVSGRPVADLALTVGPTGAVEACDVLRSAGRADFNSIACTTGVKDGGIEPVKASDGRPGRSVQALNVRFANYAHFDPIAEDRVHEAYPERALKTGVSGFAVIRCDAKPDDQLDDCAVDEESPPGFGFGEATLRLAKDGQFKLTPAQLGEVFIVMKFESARAR
jgi:hypothetical protein